MRHRRRTRNVAGVELPEEVAGALAAGQKIHAIKLLRDATGMGLAQAKRIIEMAAANRPETIGRRILTEPSEERSGLRVVVIVAALALLGYLVFK